MSGVDRQNDSVVAPHLLPPNEPKVIRQNHPGQNASRFFVRAIILRSHEQPALAFAVIFSCTGILLSSVDPAWVASISAAESLSAAQQMERGVNSFQRGEFEQAVSSWSQAARLYEAGALLGLC